MPDPKPYRPGLSISSWPESKYLRAIDHGHELSSIVNHWIAGVPLPLLGHLADDKRAIELTVHVITPPPLEQMSLILGDVVHTLRAALDGVVWAFASLDGHQPAKPKELEFPVLDKASDWPAKAKRLHELPTRQIEIIEEIQPYNFAGRENALSPLGMLHALDIQDKHRAAIELNVGNLRTNMANVGIEVRTAPTQLQMETYGHLEVTDGILVAKMIASEEIGFQDLGKPIGSVVPDFALPEYKVGVLEAVQWLTNWVRDTLDALYTGNDAAGAFLWEPPTGTELTGGAQFIEPVTLLDPDPES